MRRAPRTETIGIIFAISSSALSLVVAGRSASRALDEQPQTDFGVLAPGPLLIFVEFEGAKR
jgi:hypothetical protein